MLFMPSLHVCLRACKLSQAAAPQLQVNVKLPRELSRIRECVKPQHTGALTTHTRHHEEHVPVCGRLVATPPASSSYKTTVPRAACWGLPTLTRGDFTVSPGQTITTIHAASASTGLCKPPLRIRQAWLLLRNPWR